MRTNSFLWLMFGLLSAMLCGTISLMPSHADTPVGQWHESRPGVQSIVLAEPGKPVEAIVVQGPQWHAFAAAQIEEPPPRPVEGKKHRDKKHEDEEDFKPTPAPPPEPSVDLDVGEPDGPAKPVEKRVKPLPQPKPGKHDEEASEQNRNSHNTKVLNTIVYRTSWFAMLIVYAWLSVVTLVVVVLFRFSGLKLRSLLTPWK